MAITVIPVVSGIDLTNFINLPWRIYESYPNWVPTLKSQDRELLSPSLHPFWEHASRRLFLAKRGSRFVGRIAAIIDEQYNRYAGTRCGAFGFFECEDSVETAQALLQASFEWLASRGMQYMRGPVNPSTNYTCGILVDGFEESPALMMPWNPPYYQHLLESCHAYKEQDLFAYRIYRDADTREERESTENGESDKAQELFTFRAANKKNLAADVKTMLSLYRASWAKNWYFTPLSEEEEIYLVHELLPLIDTRFFVLFFHKNDPVAGMVALPDLTPLLRAMNGSLGLLTPWHYLKTRSQFSKSYRIMLFGILEKYRLFGLPKLLFRYMLDQAKKNPNLQWVEGSWVLEDNKAICDLIEDFSGKLVMRYRIYRKEIES